MAEIKRLSKIYKFKILEDASHALGGKYKNKPIGNGKYADISVFSFHPVKMITTGEGGIAVTNKNELFKKLSLLRSHGIVRSKSNSRPYFYKQEILGFNYRMTDFQAALGISQLKKLEKFILKRKKIFQFYNKKFKNLPIDLPQVLGSNSSSNHLYVIKIRGNNASRKRNNLIRYLAKYKINTNIHYIPIHFHPFYQKNGFKKKSLTECEDYYKRALSIPIHQKLNKSQLNLIVKKITAFFK